MRSLIRPALVALALFSSGAVAGCDDDAPPREEIEAIEAAVRNSIGHFNAADAEAFRTSFTERGFAQFVGEHWVVPLESMSSNEHLSSGLAESQFELGSFTNSAIGGESASTDVMRGGFESLTGDRFELRYEGGRWLIDGYDNSSVSPDVPDGYSTVDVRLRELSIELRDPVTETGSTAFVLRNDGELEHNISLFWLSADISTESFLFGNGYIPFDYFKSYGSIEVDPGETANLVPREELQHRDGRYVLICGMDWETGRTHGHRGMLEEFRLD
jgi:hypothetical protein